MSPSPRSPPRPTWTNHNLTITRANVPVAFPSLPLAIAALVLVNADDQLNAVGRWARRRFPDGVGPATHAAAVVVRAALTLPAAVASSAALVAAILITPPLLILGQLVVLPLKRQLLTMRPRLEAEACRCPIRRRIYLFSMIVDWT